MTGCERGALRVAQSSASSPPRCADAGWWVLLLLGCVVPGPRCVYSPLSLSLSLFSPFRSCIRVQFTRGHCIPARIDPWSHLLPLSTHTNLTVYRQLPVKQISRKRLLSHHMNIGSKSGIKQNGQDFGWMRNHGDSSRLKTSSSTTTNSSSGYSNCSKNSNNYNGLFTPYNATVDGDPLKSQSWAESCIEPSFLTSPPPTTSSNSSKFSVFGDPIQTSFSSYSDCNSRQATQHTESFLSPPKKLEQDTDNLGYSPHENDGGQLESSLASMSLHSKAETERKAPLTIESRRETSSAPKSWASIASQPVKTGKTASLLKTKMAAASALTASTRPAPIVASLEAIGSWEAKNGSSPKSAIASPPVQASNAKRSPWSSSFSASSSTSSDPTPDQSCSSTSSGRDSPSSSSQSVTSGNNNSCNSTTSNNNKSITSNSSSSGIASESSNITDNNSNIKSNSNNSTSGCSFNGNNSSSFVAQRRTGPLTSCSSIESSVSSSNRTAPAAASVNHRSSSASNTSTGGVLAGRQVHVSTGGLRDARHEKENGYRESNNHYVNSHKRNWRESNVDTATVTNDTIGNGSSSNNGPNNNCHNQVQNVQRKNEATSLSGGTSGGVGGCNGEKIAHLEPVVDPSAIMDKQKLDNLFNPKEFDLNPTDARFFVIKSYSEDDIHRSIKYSIWCSTEHGNKRLDNAFRSQGEKGPVYLFYSVNGSGHFCGMAQMMSGVDYDCSVNVWAQDKWKGQFKVKWIYVKDVPNASLRHIRLENNENKQVTNSRDTQEVPLEKGKQVLKVIHSYVHSTSIFDDFLHYERRQEEELSRKVEASSSNNPPQDALRPRNDHTLTSHRENRQIPDHGHTADGYSSHNRDRQRDGDGDGDRECDQHRDRNREMHRDPRDHRDHPPFTHRGDFHRDQRNFHKAPLQPSDRRPYERRYDTGDNSAHRDHRYSNHSLRNYEQCAPRDQFDSYYHSARRPVHHNNNHHHHNQHFQHQGNAPHYHSNSSSNSSHHNQHTSWRE